MHIIDIESLHLCYSRKTLKTFSKNIKMTAKKLKNIQCRRFAIPEVQNIS